MLAAPVAMRAGVAVFPPVPARPAITNIARIRELSRIQADQGWPLRLEGVVTLADPDRHLLVLQDAEGAAAIHADFPSVGIRPGERVRIESDNAACIAPAFSEFPFKPSGAEWLPAFSAPTNHGYYYLARIHGFLIPPATGDYNFWVSSKGSSELWMGTKADLSDLQRIAFIPDGGAVNPGQWDKYPTQCSGPVHLIAGQPCLFDLLQENQGGRDDTVSVAWQGPGMAQQVIDGRFLVPDSNRRTNGIIWEYWTNYFLGTVQPLTSGGRINPEVAAMNARFQILGDSPFPKAISLPVGSPLMPEQNYCWVEVEGTVGFAAEDKNGLTLELVQGRERTRLRVPANAETDLAELMGARVRAEGVGEAVVDSKGNQTLGMVRVPSTNEFCELESGTKASPPLKTISIGELNPANPAVAPGRRIRVRGTVVRQDGDNLIIQGAAQFCGYISTNGRQWKNVTPPVDVPLHNTALAGLLACSFGSGQGTTARFESVKGVDASAQDLEVCGATPAGKTRMQGGNTFIVQGGGTGFGPTYESLHFYCEPLAQKQEIVARVAAWESSEPQSEAGVMMRDSTNYNASFASLTLSAAGRAIFRFRQRQHQSDAMIVLPGYSAPCWLKLTRGYPQLMVRGGENFSATVGDAVDVAGTLQWDGNQPVLMNACRLDSSTGDRLPASSPRPDSTPEPSAEPSPVHIAQLLPDPDGRLMDGHGPVLIQGVVTFGGRAFGKDCLVVQDETAGALIRLNGRFMHRTLPVGELVKFELRSRNGKWPFPLEPVRVQAIGHAELPAPAILAAEPNWKVRGEDEWVQCEGIVREAEAGNVLRLRCGNGEMPVWVNGETEAELHRYVDALVQVRGVLIRRESRSALLTPSAACIEVLEPAPPQPFAIPTIAISDAKPFSRRASTCHRVKISGVVTYRKDNLMVVQDDSGGMPVKAPAPADVRVGDSVEAVGFPTSQGGGTVLFQARVRQNGKEPPPQAIRISGEDLRSGNYAGQFVAVTMELLEQTIEGGAQVLELQSGQKVFRAALLTGHERLPSIPPGSLVRVAGIAWAERGETFAQSDEIIEPLAASCDLLLRSPHDVTVLRRPAWWAWKNATMVVGSLTLGLTMTLLWIRHLHRQVARRTQELKMAMAKLAREAEASATLGERNRLAGEIHDGLEQGLSAIMMQLDGLESKLGAGPAETARQLELVRNMVRFSRTEVRHSLWDWKSPALAGKDLGNALSDIARQMSAGNETRVKVQISGNAVPLPTAVEHHLLRIAQEALNNALKYAQAGAIEISLHYGADAARLTVRDNGRGFDPETVLNGTNGHFGLQNLRSRARKMGGTLKITSSANGGTMIEATTPVVLAASKSGNTEPNSLA